MRIQTVSMPNVVPEHWPHRDDRLIQLRHVEERHHAHHGHHDYLKQNLVLDFAEVVKDAVLSRHPSSASEVVAT